jgi:putative aldouronate transport system substrate-binding protein
MFGLGLAAVMCIVSACSKDGEGKAAVSPSPTGSSTSAQTPADPFGKYDPAIEVSTFRQIDASFKFVNGESLDKNIWTPIFENELGIKVKNAWVVDRSQYHQKLNVAVASNELPDFFEVDKTEMQRLIDAGQIMDITSMYNQFASPYLKKTLESDGGTALKAATVGGKLMGIPITRSNGGVSAADMIWLRTDWLKKLNLPEPKTMDDILKIATAFSKNDPDGNGKADTIGLGVSKEMRGNIGSITGFLNGYQAYLNMWLKDSSGNLVYSNIQPEVKLALQKLQDLYKNGVLDKELAVKSWSKVNEDTAAGKLGLVYGGVAVATANGGPKDNRKNDPSVQWQAFPIVSGSSKPALAQAPETAESFYVFKKGAKNPEAGVKLLNMYLKKFLETQYPTAADNPFAINTTTQAFPATYAPLQVEAVTGNLDAFRLVREALSKQDGSKLGFPAALHFDRNMKFRGGDDSMWFSDRTFGPQGSFSVIDKYYQDKQYIFTSFTGAPTPTMVEKSSTLQKMEDELFAKIIMGAAPTDEFDKYVADWKKLGGDAITKEVNDWYAKNK